MSDGEITGSSQRGYKRRYAHKGDLSPRAAGVDHPPAKTTALTNTKKKKLETHRTRTIRLRLIDYIQRGVSLTSKKAGTSFITKGRRAASDVSATRDAALFGLARGRFERNEIFDRTDRKDGLFTELTRSTIISVVSAETMLGK
ncbi:hypothetical protein EVAR_56533_1 [Eumeta japonica]|uniref:Uncharacterized protein n=1 Tax=Eumeta variegata TaxID=151549 RepID=A0A4C1YTX0_EUMVA|nr:hypothetical protein EVAR_56533_1 [Eumeta japonica]